MSGLTRKKIKVRGKSGKTFQRSVMVRAEAIGKRAGGKKLHSLNPWEVHHVEHVNTNTKLGERQKAYGSSGPASSHSWLALATGALRQGRIADSENNNPFMGSYGRQHAEARRTAGSSTVGNVQIAQEFKDRASVVGGAHANRGRQVEAIRDMWTEGLSSRYGRSNIHEVHQDPRRHVR